jgi:hypothetical protein
LVFPHLGFARPEYPGHQARLSWPTRDKIFCRSRCKQQPVEKARLFFSSNMEVEGPMIDFDEGKSGGKNFLHGRGLSV